MAKKKLTAQFVERVTPPKAAWLKSLTQAIPGSHFA
jgi:hypothetical protein